MGTCHKKSQVSFCIICAGDNAVFVAAGCLICNHIKTSGAIFIIRQLYLILFFFFFIGTEIRGYSQNIRVYSPECPGLTSRLGTMNCISSTLFLSLSLWFVVNQWNQYSFIVPRGNLLATAARGQNITKKQQWNINNIIKMVRNRIDLYIHINMILDKIKE